MTALIACGAASIARAQETPASEIAMAREEFARGLEAAHADRWEQAREAFARAYALVPQPQILFNLAAAQAHTQELVAAAESYRRFLRDAPSDLAAAHGDEARSALADLERRIAHVRIGTAGLGAGDVVTLDEQTVSRAALGGSLPIDPGEHVATLSRAGRTLARASFTVRAGESREVRLEPIAPAARPRSAAAGQAIHRERRTARPESSSGGGVLSSPWLWIAVGVVAVGAASVAIGLTVGGSPEPYSGSYPPGNAVVQ